MMIFASMFLSMAVSAAELKVMDIPSDSLNYETHLNPTFKVKPSSEVAVLVTAITTIGWGDNQTTTTEYFEQNVPELSMNEKVLEANIDGEVVNCGYMTVSPVFKRPVLKLNGNCVIRIKRTLRTAEVFLVTK